MNSVKRLTALFVSIIMLLTVTTFTVCAADDITVSVGKVYGSVGDVVDVPVTVTAGSGIVSGAFCVEYDSDILKFNGYTEGELSQLSQCYAQEVVVGTDAVGIIFSTENAETSVTSGGTIINLQFEILECDPCTVPLTVNLVRPDEVTVEGGIADADGVIDAVYSDGYVEVIKLGSNNTRINYSISYDGAVYSTAIAAERDAESLVFKTATYNFDRSNEYAYIKYDIQSDGIAGTPVVEIRNAAGCWTVETDESNVVKIPMYVIGYDNASGTLINLKFTVNCGTDSTADDAEMSFAIMSGTFTGGASFISDFVNAEEPSTVTALDGSADYMDGYSTDIYYTAAESGLLNKTKIWVSDTAPADYTYNFESCELINDEISGKAEYTDVTFNVSPADATVIFAGKTVKATDGVAVFENVSVGQQNYTVSADGYTTVTDSVNVIYGMIPVYVSLEFNPFATVIFRVTPEEAEVEFNNEIYMVFDGLVEYYDVPFGTYDYTITYPGYETYTGTLEVDSSVETVTVDLVEIKTSTDVVFNVTPANATVVLGTTSKTAVNGVATFKDIDFGTYTYKVSASGYETVSGKIDVVNGMSAMDIALEKLITSTDVIFNVTPADATVTLNGVTVTAVDGVATFKEVEFGTYTYTVAKEGYVSASADVTVALDMAAVTVVLEEVPAEPETAPVPELVGLRTFAQSYDAETQTITVTALDANSTAGISIVIAGAELSQYTTDSGNGISVTTSGGYKRFVVKQASGLNQNFNIYYTDANGNKYTYLVNFSFIADPSVIGFDDIVTLRVDEVTYSASNKRFTLRADNARWKKSASSSGAFLYVADPDVTVTYEYTGDGKMSAASTDKYTSYTTGVNTESAGGGAYGKVGMKIYPWTNGNSMLTKVTLTKGEYSTTYEINLLLRDISYEGNVNVTEVLPLRADADSFAIDNDAKTISFETTTAYTSAGFAVAVDRSVPTLAARPRRQLTAASGYKLAHGPVSTADENKFDRYVVARLSAGTEQTCRVKVTGGEDGLEYSWYTVTVKFNRVYEGDIEFADMLTKNTDSYSFDTETNTIDITYSSDSAAIAPVLIENCKAYTSSETAVITTSIDGVKGYAVKAENGANQVVYLTLKVGNDTTVYTVNFNYVG